MSSISRLLTGGKIKITDNDGEEIKHEYFCSQVAYIMQEDCLSSHLTVEEAMNQAAKLKLSKHMNSDEIQEKINSLVVNLGLSGPMILLSKGYSSYFAILKTT